MASTLPSTLFCTHPSCIKAPHSTLPHSMISFSRSTLLNCSELLTCKSEVKHRQQKSFCLVCRAEKKSSRTPPTSDTSPLVKLAWYGSEAFGKIVSGFRPSLSAREAKEEEEEEEQFVGSVSRRDVVEAIRKDYERSYFVTGGLLIA